MEDAGIFDALPGRTDMLNYAQQYGIPVTATHKKPYSEDDNLLHISHEAGILEDPGAACDEEIYSRTSHPDQWPDQAETVVLTFEEGLPVKVENKDDGTKKTGALELFTYLNTVGSRHGIGRMDMVENRFVGIKSRGVYETPGGKSCGRRTATLKGSRWIAK